jgi:hypothetical protein
MIAAELPMDGRRAVMGRRAFVVAWVALGLAGAFDQTIAQYFFGRRFDLLLPHLKYGHVMFNKNPHNVTVFEYARDGGPRRPLAELVRTPAFGYASARVIVNALTDPMFLAEVCYRATRDPGESYTFFVDDYDIDHDTRRPARSTVFRCDSRGLAGN